MNSYSRDWNTPYKSHIVTAGKLQSETLWEQYAIKLSFELGKNATETYGMLQTAFGTSCMNRASVSEWHKRFKEGRVSVRDDERCGRSNKVNTPELTGQMVRVRVTMLRFKGSSGRDSVGRGQHSSNRVSGISSRTIPQSTTPSLSQTIWPRWESRQFFTLPIVETLLLVTFGNSLSSEAVVMRQLRRWKRLWRRSLRRSHKRTLVGPSRSCWNGTTSALQLGEITSKWTRVSCLYFQWKCPYEKSLQNYLMIIVYIYIYIERERERKRERERAFLYRSWLTAFFSYPYCKTPYSQR